MRKATFNAEEHTYTLDGKTLISVTRLMKKHGLAPDYSCVDEDVLRAKAERGTLIHKEIEDYINTGEYGFTSEFEDFLAIKAMLNLSNIKSETIVNNDMVAGTIDLTALRKYPIGENLYSTVKVIADIKTCTRVDKEAVRWQLSLYERLSGTEFDELYILHLCDKSKAIRVDRIPREEVDKLLECERNGTIYNAPALAVPNELLHKAEEAERAIKEADAALKAAEIRAKDIRAAIMRVMEEQGVKKFENDKLKITYIEPTTRENIDTARLKEELPDIADKYVKEVKVKAGVRITVR